MNSWIPKVHIELSINQSKINKHCKRYSGRAKTEKQKKTITQRKARIIFYVITEYSFFRTLINSSIVDTKLLFWERKINWNENWIATIMILLFFTHQHQWIKLSSTTLYLSKALQSLQMKLDTFTSNSQF